MRRVISRLACVALSLGMLSATPSASADDAPRHAGQLIGPARVASSADFSLVGSFPTRPRSTVRLQRRTDQGSWTQVRHDVTRKDGSFQFDLTASSHVGEVTYRAVAPARGRPALKTPAWRVEIVIPGKWAQLSMGLSYACGVKQDHSAWCWGRGGFGQLGLGTTSDVLEPRRLPGRWQTLTTSDTRTTCGIRLDGSGWCWGWYPGNGQERATRPARLDGTWRSLVPTSFTEFSSDPVSYTCGVRTDDSLWCWGSNVQGQLGVGETTPYEPVLTPRQVPGVWRQVSNVNTYTQCGIQIDGTGWCWGSNTNGQLGNGTLTSSASPGQVPGTWTSLSPTVFGHTCGIQVDATAWCWGANWLGQVGDGTTKDRLTPYRLPGAWRSLDANSATVCGIRLDQTGWCWGSNDHGQVGDGSTTTRLSPYQVAGSWVSLGSRGTTCGVRQVGSGWCWGANGAGSVGNGSTQDRLTPYQLEGRWNSIEPGPTTCGLRPHHTGACWGLNNDGGVGNAFGESLVPSRLPGRWSELTGESTRCGIRPDGTAACWGRNSRGQAGVGTRGDVGQPGVLA